MPKFETFVRMPSFHFSTDEYIEAEVESEFTFDKKGFGDCIFRYLNVLIARIFMRLWIKELPNNDDIHYKKKLGTFSRISFLRFLMLSGFVVKRTQKQRELLLFFLRNLSLRISYSKAKIVSISQRYSGRKRDILLPLCH